uniref:Uncharacterized protein n=3 Tax=Rhodosorus marinus TaxID=101924 RepID=A0A7S2ZKX5_9RHOD|mmetsp:Transcript_23267/g.92702  ORF Transcript_23267/g.92702 Transcript_23267/m.92702 type:complete len:257 (+) Transcript_23267:291-1061(+)
MVDPPTAERMSLKDRKCVVTGGTRGIGFSISKAFMEAGAEVAVVATKPPTEEVTKSLSELGRWHAIIGDLGDIKSTEAIGDEALEVLGKVDVLVNNAGVALVDELETLSVEAWDKTMAVNVRAPFMLAQKFSRGMIERRAGKIVNVTSVVGSRGVHLHAAYGASKAALDHLTKNMTVEWGKYNIQTNSVAPTIVMTDMGKKAWGDPERGDPMLARIPAGRFGEPFEVADAVLFLASDAANFISGQILCVDGGYTTI